MTRNMVAGQALTSRVAVHSRMPRLVWGCLVDQDKYWILDGTPYYLQQATRLVDEKFEPTEVPCR